MQEIWKPILKHEPLVHYDYYDKVSNTGYLVSSFGRVKRRWRVLIVKNENGTQLCTTHKDYDKYVHLGKWEYRERIVSGALIQMNKKDKNNNYRHYRLSRYFQFGIDSYEFYYGHILVVSAFLKDIPEDLEVNHRDGIKTNNDIHNLELVTHADNMKHASEHGLMNTSSRLDSYFSLSEDTKLHVINQKRKIPINKTQVIKIRRIYDRGNLNSLNKKLIADHFNEKPQWVQRIAERQTFAFISEELR